MKLRKNYLTWVAAAAAGVLLAACGSANASTPMASATTAPTVSQNIVQVASSNPDFSTLVAAVKAAGLVDTLSGPGPFTVFAPTNEAFAKLPAGTVDTLLKPENKELLTKVLTYHVVPGRMTAVQL